VSCHGAGGNSTITVNPKLAGQHEGYLYKQLVNFTTADRNQPVMTTYAKMLTDEEKHNVAAWLAAQAPSRARPRTRTPSKWARRSIAAASPRRTCRPAPAATAPPVPASGAVPALAGQHQDYTVAQLGLFKAGTRKSLEMATISKRMSDEEMKAVADYVAGLK
jgi:cytochrome c553